MIDDAVPRVADLLATEASLATVGRERERAHLTQLIEAERPVVVFVHGAGGIGKTALVRASLRSIGDAGVWLDARHVEPTERGVLAALSHALGSPCDSPAAVGAAIAGASVRTVVVDDYQRFAVVDGWLRNELLPALPDGTTTLLVGRNAPNRAWRASHGWRLLVGEIIVGPLSEADARELVARRLLPSELAARALAFGRGHPLALELAAEAFSRHADLPLHAGPPPEVVEQLVDILFDDLDTDTRRVVDAVSVLRRVTLPLLTAVLADEPERVDVHAAWRRIRELPFMTLHPTGLEMQPVIQEVAATALELRDPGRTRELRRRAGSAAFAEVERGPGWEATADLLHLVQNPVIRDAFLPPAGMQHPVERAHRDDIDAIVAIVAQHEEGSVAVVRTWWERQRDAFHVLRAADGGVAAFSIASALDAVDPTLDGADPVLGPIERDMTRRPLALGERALLLRRALASQAGDGLSAQLAPMIVDLKRTYLAMRPHLARVYSVVGHWTRDAPTLRAMGFEPRGDPLRIGGRELQICSLDFGPGSVDGWLARHIETETSRPTDHPVPSGDAEQVRDAAVVGQLSAREREVLSALARGLTNRELADLLFISERTANRHVSNIFLKLGVHNRTAAARVAVDAGLG